MRNFKWMGVDKKGFTLIELVIVVAVIGIISAIALTALDPMTQFKKASDGKIKSDLAQMQRAFESYYEDNGRYPVSIDNKIENLASGSPINWGDPWTPYMDFLPKSPGDPDRTYIYFANSDGQTYFLYANLERGAYDSQSCNGGETCASIVTNGISGTCGQENGGCNYAVTSSNVNP